MSVAGGPINTLANVVDNNMKDLPVKTTGNITNPAQNDGKYGKEGTSMKALTWVSKNKVEIVDVPKPALVDPTDIILKVTGSTICGSDIHLLHGALITLQSGDILGHEFMGIVDEVGSSVKKVKKGDRVVVAFNVSCGECFMCQKKLSSACQNTNSSALMDTMYGNTTCGMFGYSQLTGGFAGGQAEYVRVPYGDTTLKIPEGVPDEQALYLSDILPTSYNCVVDSGVKEGDIVGIWGAGPIGILCAKWAYLKGASRVILVDNVQWRLDFAKQKFPQIELVNFNEHKDVPAYINELTAPGKNGHESRPAGLDVALECAAGEYAKSWLHTVEMAVGLETDTSELLNEMIMSVMNYGAVGVTGVYAGFTNHFNIGALMQKGVRLIGNGQAPVLKYWEEILNDYIVPGKIDVLDLVVTHRVRLDNMVELYKEFTERKQGIMKVFVETQFSSPPSKGAPSTTTV